MKRRKIKKSVIYAISLTILGGIVLGSYLINNNYSYDNLDLVSKPILDNVIPVVSSKTNIIRPYNIENISILSNYYDYKDTEDRQLNSLIFYNNTYIQNTGIIYGSDQSFDVVSILDGEVIKVEDSELSGKIIEIRHSNNIISVYQFLSEVTVSVNSKVNQGDIIGKSGISNIVDNTKNQLSFELIINGELVNAENYYDKDINEI